VATLLLCIPHVCHLELQLLHPLVKLRQVGDGSFGEIDVHDGLEPTLDHVLLDAGGSNTNLHHKEPTMQIKLEKTQWMCVPSLCQLESLCAKECLDGEV
jgi:hypothetical protein